MSPSAHLVVRALVLSCLFAPAATATWSIVVHDSATGEVGLGSATCNVNADLMAGLAVIVVGKGAGAAQAQVDFTGANRMLMWDLLQEGELNAAQIVQQLKQNDLFSCSRQYGVVNTFPSTKTFTGACANPWKGGVQGTLGTLTYAIQGNVLTGEPVVEAAREALLRTPGRLSDRLMAAMQAARLMGGDGRCSCSEDAPTACGSPPAVFEKSAHIGFIALARMGDTDGVCNGAQGCANGDYWLTINVFGDEDDPDPVDWIQRRYDAFLESMRGLPDGLTSQAAFDDDVVPGDGATERTLHVVLYDVDGHPILHGGHDVSVTHAEGSAGLATPGPVVDHGDGTYSSTVTAGVGEGTDLFAVRIQTGDVAATIYPYPELDQRP